MNEQLQQMFLQLVRMVVCINDEIIIDSQRLEAFQEQQQEWTRLDIDLETIIAEIVLSMIQQVAILIGRLWEMTICDEISEQKKKEDDHLQNDTIFQVNAILSVWWICSVRLLEDKWRVKIQKIICLCLWIDLEATILDVPVPNEHLDDFECQIVQIIQIMSLQMNTIQIVPNVERMSTEDERDIESEHSRMCQLSQIQHERKFYKKLNAWWKRSFFEIFCAFSVLTYNIIAFIL